MLKFMRPEPGGEKRKGFGSSRPAHVHVGDSRDAAPILSEEAHLYRSMFENAIWGIFQTTEEGQYLTANPALARIYGYASPAEMLAALTDISRQLYVDPTRRCEFVRLMKEQGFVSGFESEVYRRDGTIIWISESCREVRATTGQFLYYEGTVEEITDRKQVEAALSMAKEQAEAANKAKSAFLANMSHELRTPLNAVLGFTEILRDELFGPLGDPRYREYVVDINASGRHLLNVINAILDLTKIEAGHGELEEEEIDIGEVMAICARLVGDTSRSRGIDFQLSPPAERALVRADPTRLKQILLNLLSNALKFTQEGGLVTLSAKRNDEGGYLILVSDTGIGMSPADLVKVLQPFEQVDTSLSRRYEGTGLGLTLTKSLVELHDGTLILDSAPGRGTTVTVCLPAWRVLQTDMA